jgi:hypothetical protein
MSKEKELFMFVFDPTETGLDVLCVMSDSEESAQQALLESFTYRDQAIAYLSNIEKYTVRKLGLNEIQAIENC